MKNFRITIGILAVSLFSYCSSAQEITTFQGMWGPEFYRDQEKLSWKEIDKIMSESQTAQINWQKSKKNLLGGLLAGAVNFGSGIWFIVNEVDDKPVTGPVIAFATTGLIGSVFYHSALKNKKKAILNYNESLGQGSSFRLVPTSNENGVGLALKF